MMNAALMLSDRLKKLRSQISEARQAGDEAATSKLIDEHNKNLKKHNEIIEKNLCRLHFELVGGGCFSVTMPCDSYANYACNPLTLVLPSLEKNIARCAAEDPDAVEEADERKAFFKTLREMLAARGARPLAVTVSADGGAAMPVDVEAPLEMSWGRWARPSKPSEVTIRFTPKALAEVLAAPRCLLVIADPGGCRLFPLDEPTLATPVLDLAWQVMGGAAVDDDDLRADALGALRRAVVPYVAVDDKADASKPGRERRADYLAKVHAGKPVNLKGLAPVRSEATIADVTDPFCDAPFAVLYVLGCGKPPECPRLTLSVRDTYGATSTTVVDSVVDSSGKWLPCDLEKLMEMAMTLATSATSAGVRGNVGDDVYRVLSKWLQNPTSVINISVNGAPPQLVLEAGAVIGDPRLARDGIATLDVDVLVPTLPAPGGRTPAQKLWLEPEVPCLLAACVAALEAGGFTVNVLESFGNCPQYIHTRTREPAAISNRPTAEISDRISDEVRGRIERSDTFFIATNAPEGVDVSHRGGRPGFVTVDEDGALLWPDFSGNNFFNTLGNLAVDPRAGLLFADFESGDLLQLAVDGALEDASAAHPEWRRSLPHNYLNYMGVIHADTAEPQRAAFHTKLHGTMRPAVTLGVGGCNRTRPTCNRVRPACNPMCPRHDEHRALEPAARRRMRPVHRASPHVRPHSK